MRGDGFVRVDDIVSHGFLRLFVFLFLIIPYSWPLLNLISLAGIDEERSDTTSWAYIGQVEGDCSS